MSATERPRRSTATNKNWSTILAKGNDEMDYESEVPKTVAGGKKVAGGGGGAAASAVVVGAAHPAAQPKGRGRKKSKLEDDEADLVDAHAHGHGFAEHSEIIQHHDQHADFEVKPVRQTRKGANASPTKAKAGVAPVPVVPTEVAATADMEQLSKEFDEHNASLDVPFDEEELSELLNQPKPSLKVPAPKTRARNAHQLSSGSAGSYLDDPNDADYVEDEPVRTPAKKARQTVQSVNALNRPVAPPPQARQQAVVVRPPVQNRVVIRQQTRILGPRPNPIVNGVPRIIHPRFQPVQRTIVRPPFAPPVHEIPPTILKNIEKLTEDLKSSASPELNSANELIAVLRQELDRSYQNSKETLNYFKQLNEDTIHAHQSQQTQSEARIGYLEKQVQNLESQLKKCSAIAHQKFLKTTVEGGNRNTSADEGHTGPDGNPKGTASQYSLYDGDGRLPRDVLAHEEEYVPPGTQYYSSEDVIQATSQQLDSMI